MADETKLVEEKLQAAKFAQAQGVMAPASELSIATAENQKTTDAKVDDTSKATFNLLHWIKTLPGATTAGGIFITFILSITPYFTGEKKISNLFDGQVLHVVVDKMPPMRVAPQPEPIPLPVPVPDKATKKLTIISIGAKLDQTVVDSLKVKGHTYTYYDAVPAGWDAITKTYGDPPRVYVADGGSVQWSATQADAEKLVKMLEVK